MMSQTTPLAALRHDFFGDCGPLHAGEITMDAERPGDRVATCSTRRLLFGLAGERILTSSGKPKSESCGPRKLSI